MEKYYEIRLESIGGLGANLCGKMLGELGVKYLDLNSTSFSSYGSEKTGTPVKGYVRYCDKEKEIRIHSPIINPDLLTVFHQALLKDEGVWEGCSDKTEVIISLDGGQKADDLQIPVSVKACYTVNAQQIAMETHSRINMVMLGAIGKVMGFVKLQDLNQICKDALGSKYPDALQGNLDGIRRGYEEVTRLTEDLASDFDLRNKVNDISKTSIQEAGAGQAGGTQKISADKEKKGWGYLTAPAGGINPRFGNSVAADLSPSRQGFIPVFIKERCINCGMCDTTCPDMVFQFAKGVYRGKEMMVNQGLDYYHCKGCLRCVEVCPVNALVQGLETEHPDKDYFLPNQDIIRKPEYYIKAGADGYITSESYLTEKRMEGGEV